MKDPLDRIDNINYFELAEAVTKRVKVIKSKLKNIKVKHTHVVSENIGLVWMEISETRSKWNLVYINKELGINKELDQCTAKNRMIVGLQNLDDFIHSFADNLESNKQSVNYNR